MMAKRIGYIILLFSAYLFIVFNYMPTVMRSFALENERQILLQVLSKNSEFEKKLMQERLAFKPEPLLRQKRQQRKNNEGNRGYLIKEGRPTK